MQPLKTSVWCALVAAAAVVLAPAARADDDAAWMFSPRQVVGIEIGLDAAAREALEVAPKEWVPATFSLSGSEGREFGPADAELKLKGNASFRPLGDKAAFKLKFKSGARPWGLKKITLNNMVQDPSKVRETTAYEVFRGIGVPAPRTGYAEVELNGESYGLYLNVEVMTEEALARWFPSTRHLYEGEDVDLLPGSAPAFEVDEGDEDDRSDLESLIEAAYSGAPSWFEDLAAVADVGEMVRMWAGEVFLQHWDGFVTNGNNYYLHSDGDGVFSWMPSGTDQALAGSRAEYFLIDDTVELNRRQLLVQRCLLETACRAQYAAALQEARDEAAALDVPGRSFELFEFLEPYIAADPMLEHSVADARATAELVGEFARAQSRRLDEVLVATPLPPPGLTAVGADGVVVAAWGEPLTYGAEPVSGYAVQYRRAGRDGFSELTIDDPAQRFALISSLRKGTAYEVRVRALSGAGPGTASVLSASTLAPTLARPTVTPALKRARPGERVALAITVRSDGDIGAPAVRACVRGPHPLIRIRRCAGFGALRAGQEKTVKVIATVRARAERGGKARVGFEVSGEGTKPRRTRAVIRVG